MENSGGRGGEEKRSGCKTEKENGWNEQGFEEDIKALTEDFSVLGKCLFNASDRPLLSGLLFKHCPVIFRYNLGFTSIYSPVNKHKIIHNNEV